MKMTAKQAKLYLEGKLRIATNPYTKESRLVRVTKPPAHDKGKTDQLERAYFKLCRLADLEKSRGRKREYMRRLRSLQLMAPEVTKVTRRVRTTKPELVQLAAQQAPVKTSWLRRLLGWSCG